MDTLKKMYWSSGAKMRANRVRGKRKETKLEMETVKRINETILELAKLNEGDVVMHEPSDCAQWQWDILMEQELQDEGIE